MQLKSIFNLDDNVFTWVQYYAAMYFNHSAMRKVHQVNGHVVYVHWIDTVYVQNNLPTKLSKMTIFII